MATATTLSSSVRCITNLQPTKLHHYSSSQSNLSFHNRILRFHKTQRARLSICHGQLDGSAGEIDNNEIGKSFFDDDDDLIDDDEDSSDEDDTESSVDLLIKFFQTLFKKASRRAKKASRSVLPAGISPQLVSFAVDGILILASLSIIKAFLEVVCTLGGTVFVVILLLRVIWAAISFFQSNENSFYQGSRNSFHTTPRPVT